MSTDIYTPGREARKDHGFFKANKWLLFRRIVQFGILGLFMVGPISVWVLDKQSHPTEGLWIVKGTLSSSLTLDVLPLTDPFIALQTFLAGHILETTALTGVLIVIAFYILVGGRTYCSWVCPINVVSDTAHWAREKLAIKGGLKLSLSTRYWIMAATLVVSFMTGVVVWEMINPITILYRGFLFGVGLAWMAVLGVFLFDLFVARRGWCTHLCPVGAFYSIIGKASLLRVSAQNRASCNDCLDCYAVCPEGHVITPALKGADKGMGPVILSPNCTNCGRCIDVCSPQVFNFTSRFNDKVEDRNSVADSNLPQTPKAAA